MATNFKTNNTAVETAYATYAGVNYPNLFGVGYNGFGVLGVGDGTHRPFTASGNLYAASTSGYSEWQSTAAGGLQSFAIKQDGSLWATGWNNAGGLGLGDTTQRNSFTKVTSPSGTWSMVDVGKDNPGFSIAIKTDGTMWSCGENEKGNLGQNDITDRSSFTQIGAGTTWSKVYIGSIVAGTNSGGTVLAIKTDGTLWSWGENGNGQLGLGDTTLRSSPVQVGALTNWASASVGYTSSLAVKTDGTLWAWGWNPYGQLGLGDITHRSSPVQVGALTNWSSVSTGGSSTIAIKTDGTLWSWGLNTNGQLGSGTVTHRSSPVQVGALTNWSKISTGLYHAAAIKTDGTLWSWGKNADFNVSSSGVDISSPIQIGTSTTWSTVSAGSGYAGNFTLAIEANKVDP